MTYYFDNAATTPICSEALNVLCNMNYMYGNPSAHYSLGRQAKKKMEEARETIAECIGADSRFDIIFTSGGTESDNMVVQRYMKNKMTIFHSPFEHPAVLKSMENYPTHGAIDHRDECQMSTLKSIYSQKKAPSRKETRAMTYMLANNETGIISPVKKIANTVPCHFVHTDAVQAVGHIPVNVKDLGVDLLSASAHKFNGPKGVGFLYARDAYFPNAIIRGGGQERGYRSGTENTIAILAMAEALKFNCSHMEEHYGKVKAMRDYIENTLLNAIPDMAINGDGEDRLPGHSNITIKHVDGGTLQALLDTNGICISTGSACHSESMDPSHVLKAMGLTDDEAYCTIRISVGPQNTMQECEYLCTKIIKSVDYLRSKI